MLIAGLNTLTLLDFPGKTAAIIFTAGCNMRCGYCHNANFVLPENIQQQKKNISWNEIESFLEKRKGLLDGVVISGGEPTLQKDLKEIIQKIKKMGFLIKLDTNGTNPFVLESLIQNKLLDFIAMDIKGSEEIYNDICSTTINIENIKKSIKLIMHSNIDYEFRSTILPEYHTNNVLDKMGLMIKGSKLWALQNFRTTSVLDVRFHNKKSFSIKELEILKDKYGSYVQKIEIRY
jgi:pyruvate formate lyase activating enzyme